jgi:AcrR family transcriptional regulator
VVSNVGKQRARKPEDKDQRRRDILAAAQSLWPRTGFTQLTMTAVAENAGIAKGTVYLYFASKEQLLLALLEEQFHEWFDALAAALDRHEAAGLDAGAFASLVASSLADRTSLAGLIAILDSILEHNVDLATARRFKTGLRRRTLEAAPRVERLLGLRAGQGARLLLHIHALVVGLWHMANPAPVMREALTAPELGLFRIDFAPELTHVLAALIQGLQQGNKERGT